MKKACDHENDKAYYAFGTLYESGFQHISANTESDIIINKDTVQAKKFYHLAAEKDNPSAFYKLACISFNDNNIRESINYLKVFSNPHSVRFIFNQLI